MFDQTTEKCIESSTKITGNIAVEDLEKSPGLALYLKVEFNATYIIPDKCFLELFLKLSSDEILQYPLIYLYSEVFQCHLSK